jgi:hypothetical protein
MNFDEIDLMCACSDEVIRMSFRDPWLRKSYVVRAILGLDLDEIVTKYQKSNSAGTRFYKMSLGKREVVLRVALNPNYQLGETAESLRSNVYKAITANRTGAMSLRFKSDKAVVGEIHGFVKKVEAGLFSETPEIQITLDCSRDPLIRAYEETIVDIGSFASERDAELDDPLSTAPHGLQIIAFCQSATNTFTIADTDPHIWSFDVTPGTISGVTGFISGDIIGLSSEDHNRYITVERSGQVIHLAHKVHAGSVWPYMFPGLTTFRIKQGFSYTQIKFKSAYWGL